MATEDLEPAAPEEQQASSSSKKRKSALAEIQVDLSLPEPPSKKARRALKKGKSVPAKPTSSDDEEGKTAAEDGKPDGAKGGKTKKTRSPHGVWIGNLPFSATKADLRKWLVDNSGGSITDDIITRVHMPTTKRAAGAAKTTPENRGFAYVDFATFEANVAAIALSETELGGRKLLIKDSKSFEGRPAKEAEPEAVTDSAAAGKAASSAHHAAGKKPPSTKIFVGNLAFNTTEDDLHAHFEKCGKIRWVKVATFEDSGKCKGYGWVSFEDPEAAAWAVKGFVKVRETVETVEDFMDEDTKAADVKAAEEKAHDGGGDKDESEQDESDDEDNEPKPADQATKKKKTTTTTTTKEPPRTRTRKWWVNQLLGRNLKIELAEDDQTRYHKRFGKGAGAAAKQKTQKTQKKHAREGGGGGEEGSGGGQDGEKDGGPDANKEEDKKNKKKKKELNYHSDIGVARLTGAAVAHQGKKITFD
ncbi:hypothetical protein VTK56DRAFT_1055 [Thermocarpiscus australiensis]